jgi:E3 ubiquitin-protein ligase DOA10
LGYEVCLLDFVWVFMVIWLMRTVRVTWIISVIQVFKFIGFVSVIKAKGVIITLNEYAKEREAPSE